MIGPLSSRMRVRAGRVTRAAAVTLAMAIVAIAAAPIDAQSPGGKAPTPNQPPLPRANAGVYVIQHAKIFTLAGAPIERGSIVIEGGRITAVGATVTVPAGAEIVNGEGLQVYPGLFDSVTRLGLTEIGAVSATNDYAEIGGVNPQLVAASAINPVSDHIPVARAAGITHAISTPDGGLISGQASAIHLDGWTVEEMAIAPSVALAVNWPSLGGGGGFDFATFTQRRRSFADAKQEYEKQVRELEGWLDRARQYQQATAKPVNGGPARDLKLEALLPVLSGARPLLVTANSERDIRNAIAFCEKQKIRMILAGATDAYRVAAFLAEKKVPVILGPTQDLPSREDEPYDIRNTTPGVLQKAGVLFALATFNSSDSRTLPVEIGNAVSYGLSQEDAVKAITINPARIFGLDRQLGTLEVGKLGNLIVTTGDPLEIRTQVKYLFIKGQPTSLDNRHLNLYEKWRSRPLPSPGGAGTKAPPTSSSR